MLVLSDRIFIDVALHLTFRACFENADFSFNVIVLMAFSKHALRLPKATSVPTGSKRGGGTTHLALTQRLRTVKWGRPLSRETIRKGPSADYRTLYRLCLRTGREQKDAREGNQAPRERISAAAGALGRPEKRRGRGQCHVRCAVSIRSDVS